MYCRFYLPVFRFRFLGLHWRVCRFLSVPAKRLVAVRLITVFDVTDFVASTGPLMRCFFIKCVNAAIPVSSIEPKSGTERLSYEPKCEVKFYLSPRISNQNLAQRQIPQYRLFSLFIAPKVTTPAFDLLNLVRFLRYFHIRCLRRYASNPEILAKDCASASRIASVKKRGGYRKSFCFPITAIG